MGDPHIIVEKELLRPEAYPEPTKKVDLIQTHISFIFITDKFVYKVKKPVDFGFLDFATLEKRKYHCEQELLLNRRLSPNVYLSVQPVTEDNGRLYIGGKGRIIDYAVKMEKLPMDKLMLKLLKENKLTPSMVVEVAKKIAEFHEQAETSAEIAKFGKVGLIKKNTDENFEQTKKYIGKTITEDQFNEIKKYTNAFYENKAAVFKERILENRIKDCHGDMHMEHICVTKPVIIFDCIEFNKRFRYSDTAADIAFLAMDLDFNKRHDLSEVLMEAYIKHSGDENVLKTLDFYKIYRAYVRGKVIGFMLGDGSVPEKDKELAAERAKKYFELAYSYIKKEPKASLSVSPACYKDAPVLIITCGLMGTGKSTIAKEIAELKKLAVFSSDVVRKDLAGISEKEHRYEDYSSGIYSKEFSEKTYQKMFELADEELSHSKSVLLDACFPKKWQRAKAKETALKNKSKFICLEFICPDDEIKKRLDNRYKTGEDASDGRWEIFYKQKNEFEKVDEISDNEHVVMNSVKQFKDIIKEIEEKFGKEV